MVYVAKKNLEDRFENVKGFNLDFIMDANRLEISFEYLFEKAREIIMNS